MLYVKVLKDLEREGAVILLCWNSLQDLLECVYDVGNDELVLLVDCVTILLVFLTEDPTIDPLRNGNLLLFEEAQQSLNQYFPIILSQQLRLDP